MPTHRRKPFGLTGRASLIQGSVLLVLGFFFLFGPFAEWIIDSRRVGELWSALPLIFAVLVGLKMIAVVWIAVRLYHGRLLSDRALVTEIKNQAEYLDGANAQLVRLGDRVQIVLPEYITDRGSRRFGIAHEIYHYLKKHPSSTPTMSSRSRRWAPSPSRGASPTAQRAVPAPTSRPETCGPGRMACGSTSARPGGAGQSASA